MDHPHPAAARAGGRLRAPARRAGTPRGRGTAGPILFQLPPDLRVDVALLARFLAALPRGLRAAWEFRHPSWFIDEVYATLHESDMALCWAEAEKLTTPRVVTASSGTSAYAGPTTRSPSPRVADALGRELLAGREVYAFFKNTRRARGSPGRRGGPGAPRRPRRPRPNDGPA